MKSRRLQIDEALKNVIHAQQAREFQWLAVQIGKAKWPELEATLEQADGGEDATAFFAGSDGRHRRLAASLTGTLEKVRADAARLRDRSVKLDVLVFVTPVPLSHLQVSDWCKKIYEEFHHELHVISQAEIVTLLEQPCNADLCRRYLHLDFADEPGLDEFEATARTAAHVILEDWKAEFGCDPSLTIELTLVREPSGSSTGTAPGAKPVQTSLGEVAKFTTERGRVVLTGAPGAGKTFTLIQLADFLLKDASAPIPVLVSLPGWASRGCDFQTYVEQQLRGRGLSETGFARLRTAGRMALLLNGWNEILESFGATKATGQLQDFALSNAATPLVVSTRTTTLAPPLSHPASIRVEPLSRQQKLHIIQRSGLHDPSKLLHALERNPTLASVTETPLFLAAIIELARGGFEQLPATRFGILNSIIYQTEQKASAALADKPCEGFHRRYLAHIAFAMTHAGTTAFAREALLAAVAEGGELLQRERHMQFAPTSSAVVESLVKHHLLVFSPSHGGAYRFAHQQFQEWFAAESLHRGVVSLAKEEHSGRVFEFQRDVLNHVRWLQPLTFLLERLGGDGDEECRLAVKLIEWVFPLDLVYAAELAGIAGEGTWALVRGTLGPALRAWYARASERHRRCAVAAMLATKAPDFQDILWSLLESDDQQVRLWTCRMWRPFPLTCLGTNWRSRFDKWDEQRRAEFVQEMNLDPGDAHIAFATELAKAESSSAVKLACLDLLARAGAYETVVEFLETPSFGVSGKSLCWQVLRWSPRRHLDRFVPQLKAALGDTDDPSNRHLILELLHAIKDSDWLSLAKAEVQRLTKMPGVSLQAALHWLPSHCEKQELNVGPYVASYLEELFQAAPDWAADWLVSQLAEGRLWEEPFVKHLNGLPDALLEKLVPAALDLTPEVNAATNRATLFAGTGSPIAARAVLKAHIEFVRQHTNENEPVGFDRGDVLRAAVLELPLPCLTDTILEMAKSMTEFQDLRVLVETALPGVPIDPNWRLQLSEDQRDSLRTLVFRLHDLEPSDLQDKDWFQAELAALLGAVGKPEDVILVETWIEEERRRRAVEDAEWQAKLQAWRAGDRTPRSLGPRTMRMAWSSWCEALVQLGGSEAAEVLLRLLRVPEFLGGAAWGLVRLARTENQDAPAVFGHRLEYAKIYERQQTLAASGKAPSEVAKRYADAICGVVQDFLPELERPDSKVPKHELFRAAAALARLDHERGVPLLFKLSADKLSHGTVAQAFRGLLLDGLLLPGKEVADALEPFIEEHEKEACGSGNDNWYVVVECVALLLFSDNPRIGVGRIRQLPSSRLKSYHFRDILGLLGLCHAPEAAEYLLEVSGVREIRDHCFRELVMAMSENVNPQPHHGLLNLLDGLAARLSPRGHDRVEPLAKAIARVAKTDAEIWDEIKSRCKRARSMAEQEVLAQVLHEIGSDGAAAVLCDLIHDEFPILYRMEQLVEAVAERRVPAGGSGAYYLEPRAVVRLRKRLFDIAVNDSTRRMSTLELLAVIAECRLEHGQPQDEPLHPDIELLKQRPTPWPLLGWRTQD